MSRTRQWRSSVGSPLCSYLAAIALTPAHAPDSGSSGAEIVHWATVTAVNCSRATCSSPWGWLWSWSSPPGLYRIIRRAEGKDGWLAMASLASVGCRRWDLRCRHGAVHGRRLPPGHRSRCGAGALGRRLAGVQHRGVRVQRLDRDRRRSHAPAPGAAGMDGMDRGPGGADRLRRSVRREGGNRSVLSARLVRPGRRLSRSARGYSPSPWRPGDRPAIPSQPSTTSTPG